MFQCTLLGGMTLLFMCFPECGFLSLYLLTFLCSSRWQVLEKFKLCPCNCWMDWKKHLVVRLEFPSGWVNHSFILHHLFCPGLCLAGAYSNYLWARAGVHPGYQSITGLPHRDSQPHTLTPGDNLE